MKKLVVLSLIGSSILIGSHSVKAEIFIPAGTSISGITSQGASNGWGIPGLEYNSSSETWTFTQKTSCDLDGYIEANTTNQAYTALCQKLAGTFLQTNGDGSGSLLINNTNVITKKTDGSVHIGENSAVFKEENGREKFWAQDANGKSIPIDITNGSKLLINGRDVEQSINNIGALSAALTGLPTVPTDTTLACGLGTGTHGGDFAFSGGCASKVNEKLSINYAASMTMPGQDYAGDFEDTFSARAGFVWKLGKATKPIQISMKEKNEFKKEISELRENNNKIISQNKNLRLENQSIISQNKKLLARLERLEKVALDMSKSQDLATIKLP